MKDALIRLLLLTNIALLIIAAAPKKKVLTANEIDIVDEKGVVRARLGGNLPETYQNGKPIGRGIAGLLIYDKAGVERGGYITFANDHAALTLDTKKDMVAMLIAGPTGASALTLNSAQYRDVVDLRVDPDNGPSIHVLHDKKVAFHQPPAVNFEKGPDCAELREGLKVASRDQLLDACRRRQPEEACQACLGGQ
ncbi:MAG TPA: hypothetical protein VG323_16395 [Thermoanaerobaculia bacterium]|nr:hypothetical protein [Thermoanaerobaculia bacterium]